MAGLLAGLGLFAGGVLYLSYPGDPHDTWLNWVPGTLAAVALALLTRLRPGYAMPDVDTFLGEVTQASW